MSKDDSKVRSYQLPQSHPSSWPGHAVRGKPSLMVELKARQSAKIKEVGDALVADGYCVLDAQAKVLGLSRSTTWTILRASHKSSGLSAAIINRMLASPELPPRVRLKVFEYIKEKSAGYYGDSKKRLVKFAAQVSADSIVRSFAPELPTRRSPASPVVRSLSKRREGSTEYRDGERDSDEAI